MDGLENRQMILDDIGIRHRNMLNEAGWDSRRADLENAQYNTIRVIDVGTAADFMERAIREAFLTGAAWSRARDKVEVHIEPANETRILPLPIWGPMHERWIR